MLSIKNFAIIISPLNTLKKKCVPFQWTGIQQHSFEKLKEALTPASILSFLDYSLPLFFMCADASFL